MLTNILMIVVFIALILFFGWLTRRAWRSRRAFIKWPGAILAGLLAVIFILVTGTVLFGFYKMNTAPASYAVANVKVDRSADKVARGEQLAHICVDCHSSSGQLPLDGGKENYMASVPQFGSIYAVNLTPGGPLKDWSDGEILRAIREGIDKNGRPLLVMPSQAMHNLSDSDAQSLVAYLRSQPAIQNDAPERDMSALSAALVAVGLFPTSAQTPITQPIVAPAANTREYGEYLVRSLGCPDCHGAKLTGSSGGLGPSGPNLTLIVPKWNQADFANLFRKGIDPTGRPISEQMPWKNYNLALADSDLADIYRFLHALEPVAQAAP